LFVILYEMLTCIEKGVTIVKRKGGDKNFFSVLFTLELVCYLTFKWMDSD